MNGALMILLASTVVELSGTGASSGAHHCLRTLAPISRDSVPESEEFAPADCAGEAPQHVFRYDRSQGATRAARDVASGEIVAPFPEFGEDFVLPGQPLNLVVAVGDVRVERKVVALQEARSGERLFVRSPDGQVLSVRYEAGAK
jgi:hypothetical protein